MRWVACLTMCLCFSELANAQGPLRRAARGAAEVTAGAARVTAGAARAGVDAVTPAVPAQASVGGPVDRNASWRRVNHNGDWWYYSPNNTWSYYRNNQWTPYVAETYTPNPQYASSSTQSLDSQQMVFIDSGGRAVICQNGRIAFVDGTALQSVSRTQVDAQGYLIQQGQVQGQATVGAVGQTQLNQDAAAIQSNGQVNAQGSIQPAPPSVQGQVQGGAIQGQPQSSTVSGSVGVQGDASQPAASISAGATSNSTSAPTSGTATSGDNATR
jgi:hypothetical protein